MMRLKSIVIQIMFYLLLIPFKTYAISSNNEIYVRGDSISENISIEDSLGITAKQVIDNYLKAIGGKDIFSRVEDRITIMRGTAMGQNLTILVKQKAPDKLYQEIKVGEMKQYIYFNGVNGAMIIGENTIQIENKELEKLKIEATLNLLLDPESYGLKIGLTGIELVDSSECYAIKMVLPSGLRWHQYYSIHTSLKVKDVKEMQTQQGLFEQETFYYDYRVVDGLKHPFMIVQNMGTQRLELNISSVKLNTGIDDDVFNLPE